jgi:hypothetical protein
VTQIVTYRLNHDLLKPTNSAMMLFPSVQAAWLTRLLSSGVGGSFTPVIRKTHNALVGGLNPSGPINSAFQAI